MPQSIKYISTCLSPELIHLYNLPGTVVVVVDILRATSCITTAIAHHIRAIKPVESLVECKKWQDRGYIGAAEREGQRVDGFELGNSPFSFMNPDLEGKSIAFTTTNGTEAIVRSAGANQVIIGAFINFHSLVNYLKKLPYDVIILCAGWKGKINMEDTLFAGAVIESLLDDFDLDGDAARVALQIYRSGKDNMYDFLSSCSHMKRLRRLGLEEDIHFCLQFDKYNVIPILKEGQIVKMSLSDMLF